MKPDITKGDHRLLQELRAKGHVDEAWCRGEWHSLWVRHGHGRERLVRRDSLPSGKARYTPWSNEGQDEGTQEVSG